MKYFKKYNELHMLYIHMLPKTEIMCAFLWNSDLDF
jgi:hypothetical protein